MNPAVDVSCTVETVAPDAKLRAHDVRRQPGGGGINVARVVHRLGGRVRAVHLAGGATGDLLEGLLTDEGVDQHRVAIQGATRESLTVLEANSGHQYRFVMAGPRVDEGEAEKGLDAALDAAPSPAYVVAAGSLPPGVAATFYATVARRAHEHGVRVVVDTSGEALRHAARAGVFLLKPNLRELGHLAGRELQDEADIERQARRLLDAGHAAAVVVSLGAGGVVLATPEGSEHIPTPTVPIRSKVGAGDSMVAGIVHRLAQGEGVGQAVRFGVAAGAAAVMTPGTDLARRAETEKLFRQMRTA